MDENIKEGERKKEVDFGVYEKAASSLRDIVEDIPGGAAKTKEQKTHKKINHKEKHVKHKKEYHEHKKHEKSLHEKIVLKHIIKTGEGKYIVKKLGEAIRGLGIQKEIKKELKTLKKESLSVFGGKREESNVLGEEIDKNEIRILNKEELEQEKPRKPEKIEKMLIRKIRKPELEEEYRFNGPEININELLTSQKGIPLKSKEDLELESFNIEKTRAKEKLVFDRPSFYEEPSLPEINLSGFDAFKEFNSLIKKQKTSPEKESKDSKRTIELNEKFINDPFIEKETRKIFTKEIKDKEISESLTRELSSEELESRDYEKMHKPVKKNTSFSKKTFMTYEEYMNFKNVFDELRNSVLKIKTSVSDDLPMHREEDNFVLREAVPSMDNLKKNLTAIKNNFSWDIDELE